MIEVRSGNANDLPAILALREMQMREYIGNVPLLPNLSWLVAEKGGRIVAAAGGQFLPDGSRSAIVTDFYDDGTLAGKRGLLLILDDAASGEVGLVCVLPLDRPGVAKALVNTGFEATGIEYTLRKGMGRRRRAEQLTPADTAEPAG